MDKSEGYRGGGEGGGCKGDRGGMGRVYYLLYLSPAYKVAIYKCVRQIRRQGFVSGETKNQRKIQVRKPIEIKI